MAQGKRKIGILGLSFKAGTDDLRCSPIVEIVEALLGKGFQISIYDRNVQVSRLTGTNLDFIMSKIPHLQHFVTDNLEAVADDSDVLVVTNKEAEFADLPQRFPGKIIVDLVRMWDAIDYDGHYDGLGWASINSNTAAQVKETSRDFQKCRF
jgi:GDP-mannose 6-dehydrogenase